MKTGSVKQGKMWGTSRSNSAQSSNVPRSHEDYKSLVSEEIKGRVTKKLFQQFSRKENRILGALSRLDDFLMYPLIQGHSGTALEMFRNAYDKNQGNPQSDPHPETGLLQSQTTRNSGPDVGHDMVTGVHDQVTYCSPTTSSGKQKKNHSTSQPQCHSGNTSASIEAERIFLGLSTVSEQ